MTNKQKSIKNNPVNDGILLTRNLILRLMCGIYLAAFTSFYYQSSGLFGNNGILPARNFIETTTSTFIAFTKTPTLLHFGTVLGLDTEKTLELISILGLGLSFIGLIAVKFCILPLFAILWILYFSIFQVTDVFGDQSDRLLLESSFICIALAPLYRNKHSMPTDKIAVILLKWILFRFLFESGSVKIISRCPKWWKLTAHEYYFETMPLPTIFAYYFHKLPEAILKTSTTFSIISEVIIPWLFFFPHRGLRQIMFYWQIYYQLFIILTGNYGIQSLLILVLSLTLLNDQHFEGKTLFSIIFQISKNILVINIVLIGAIIAIGFTDVSFEITADVLKLLIKIIPTAPALALVILILTTIGIIISHPVKKCCRNVSQKMYFINTTIGYSILAASFLVLSMVPFGNLDASTNISNSKLGEHYEIIKKIHVINQYGQQVNKMRTERLEVIFEYAQNAEGPWTEYQFLYKPWAEHVIAPWTGLYLPRLDFRLYDASQTNYRSHLWTASLAYRLLTNEPQVLKLLGYTSPIVPAPEYVRAKKYKFWYTAIDSKKDFWVKLLRSEYLPAVSKNNTILLSYLKSLKITTNQTEVVANENLLGSILDAIRQLVDKFEGASFTCTIITSALTIILIKELKHYLKIVSRVFE